MRIRIIGILILALSLASCRKSGCTNPDALNYDAKAKVDDGSCVCTTSSSGPTPYQLNIPATFARFLPAPTIPVDNPMTVEGVALGKKLFFDPQLSADNTLACAGCHFPQYSFDDTSRFSVGIDGIAGDRNAMPIFNHAWNQNGKFFWDGRATKLEDQVLLPISNHIEMGLDDKQLLEAKIEGSPMYKDLFANAFANGEISSENIGKALANFVASIISYNTKFDRVNRKEDTYTPLETKGKELFDSKYQCISCHGGNNLNSTWGGSDFANIGLSSELDPNSTNGNLFKVPSLRNVAVTGPYMHDGSINSLEKVIDHYSTGMKMNSAMDWRLQNFASNGGMNITKEEKEALIAFLKTLTDHQMLSNQKWSNPF